MSEFIEQSMRTLKLGGMAREWRSVQYENTEQYITDLLRLELREREANRINRMVKTAGFRDCLKNLITEKRHVSPPYSCHILIWRSGTEDPPTSYQLPAGRVRSVAHCRV